MLQDIDYPGPLPLSRAATIKLLDRLDDFNAKGDFLSFVMIPFEERIGSWCFAGASRSLAEAVRHVDDFARASRSETDVSIMRILLGDEPIDPATDYVYIPNTYPPKLNLKEPYRLVFLTEYGAPYDGFGACIVEITTLSGTPYENRLPENELPTGYSEHDDCEG